MSIYEKDKSYILNTYNRFNVEFVKGENVFLIDKNNNYYLDTFSGLGVNLLGYNYPEISKKLIEYSEKYLHLSNYYPCEEQVNLAEKLIKLTNLDKVFFTNSGTESIECALKIVKKLINTTNPEKNKILAFKNSFHGRTLGSLSLTLQSKYQDNFLPLFENIISAEFNNENFFENVNLNEIAAIILEPIQGEGGIRIASTQFMKKLNDICKKYNILLIFDEIQSGVGRTGSLFFHDFYKIKPDILITAKGIGGGLPLGVVIIDKKLNNIFSYGEHGSTFGGNPLSCALGNVVLDTITKKDFLSQVIENSNYFINNLKTSDIIMKWTKEIRAAGYMIGIELDLDNSIITKIKNSFFEKKILVNFTQVNILRLLPPLIFNKSNWDQFLDTFEQVIMHNI